MMRIGILEVIIVLGMLALVGAVFVAVIAIVTRQTGGAARNNPNLLPCPDCGQPISARAAVCPHCGGPSKACKLRL